MLWELREQEVPLRCQWRSQLPIEALALEALKTMCRLATVARLSSCAPSQSLYSMTETVQSHRIYDWGLASFVKRKEWHSSHDEAREIEAKI